MRAAAPRAAALALMAASGFAGLGYQIVWTQQSALWLGHEAPAVLAVVAAFFGGLALGALLLGGRIERSARAVRWYAGCELVIGAWSLALAVLMAPANAWLQDLTGLGASAAWQWSVAFGGTFLLLLPATFAMGATLPSIERLVAGSDGTPRSIAALYAANTFGAVAGVLAAAFVLVPGIGLARTAGVCCVLNLLCAGVALRWLSAPRPAPGTPLAVRRDPGRLALGMLAWTGFLGIGYEVLVVRVLSQVTEDTVYTFAVLLAVYLVGTALGAAGHARWARRSADQARLGDRLAAALAASCLLGTGSLWGAQRLHDWLRAGAEGGAGGMAAAVGAEALLALAAFGLPTVAMGALFSHLCARAAAAGRGFGRAVGANTLGAACAPGVFGVLAVPLLGAKVSLLLVAAGYLLILQRNTWRSPVAWMPAAATAALLVAAPPLVFVDVPPGGQVASYAEGVMAAVSVVEDAGGVARLRIDNRQQEGSSATRWVDARQALLPVLLHPAPRRALFLGLGTGVTAASATLDPALEVDAVELLPEVIQASARFDGPPADGTRLDHRHLLAADARRFVRRPGPAYDVIVSDNFHPARSGSGALYTVEHFNAVRARLAPGGVFCQWLPLHQLDLATTRSIVRSFLAAFPHGTALLASNSLETPVIGLVGRADDGLFRLADLQARRAGARWGAPLAAFGLDDDYALLGSFVAGPAALARFAAGVPANTDDRPVVAYLAPRITYAADSLPRDRLLALMGDLSIMPPEVLGPDADADAGTRRRLVAYWLARDRFVAVGRDVRPSPDPGVMLAQVRGPLLAVLETSPDFRPAYDPLLRMALAVGRSDAAAEASLLGELARLQPARDEAPRALRALALAQASR